MTVGMAEIGRSLPDRQIGQSSGSLPFAGVRFALYLPLVARYWLSIIALTGR